MTTPTIAGRDFDGITIPEPGTFTLDAAHSTVGFVARHLMVSKVRGSFTDVSGVITIADQPLESSVDVVIGAGSITTGAPDRDQHLRSSDFLDLDNHPTITFRGTRVVSHSGPDFVLAGELTIRGVTREVELAVEFDGLARSPWGQEVIAFTATTEIDREEFGITWNAALETGGVLVGRKVKVEISVEATRA
jgi:polyisoprenoid-binding protein YceI